jgi:hypothetical protein
LGEILLIEMLDKKYQRSDDEGREVGNNVGVDSFGGRCME